MKTYRLSSAGRRTARILLVGALIIWAFALWTFRRTLGISYNPLLFWGSLAFALFAAFLLTVPVNRWLIGRGRGHTAVHETGIHGGPPTWAVGAAVAFMAVFGTAVLVAEAL